MRALCLLLALVGFAGGATAGVGERFIAGTHYDTLPAPVSTHDPKRIEVLEVFSYVCPHCFHLDPTIAAWRAKQPPDVDFQRMPAVWNAQWRLFGQGYYAAQSLNVAEAAHASIFKALHVDQKRIDSPADLAKVYAMSGVPEAAFLKAMDSFGVRASVQQADARTRGYGVTGVPALIVNGKYRVTGDKAGSNEGMLEVVDFLVQMERDARAAGAKPSAAPKPAAKPPRPKAARKAAAAPTGKTVSLASSERANRADGAH